MPLSGNPLASVLAPLAETPRPTLETIGTPVLWAFVLGLVVLLIAFDFIITRKPHAVSMREAAGWSIFYVALPLAFGVYIWADFGSERGLEYLTGYLVEKSLSVDNLFVFMLLLSAFLVPKELQQRVLLYGIVGAIVLRGIFIALGAAALARFDWMFLVFGIILALTAVKILRDTITEVDHDITAEDLKSIKFVRRFVPVTDRYEGTKVFGRVNGKRALTPFALVVLAVFTTDVVFAVDSVPAVYGITGDPFLVFATNAFALLGLRALFFVVEGALSKLVHLGFGLSVILGFIGVKLALHWAHMRWESVPEIPTLWSLGFILGVLSVTVMTSLFADSRNRREATILESDRPASHTHVD